MCVHPTCVQQPNLGPTDGGRPWQVRLKKYNCVIFMNHLNILCGAGTCIRTIAYFPLTFKMSVLGFGSWIIKNCMEGIFKILQCLKKWFHLYLMRDPCFRSCCINEEFFRFVDHFPTFVNLQELRLRFLRCLIPVFPTGRIAIWNQRRRQFVLRQFDNDNSIWGNSTSEKNII